MARVLITGGAGFIGSHLADELISQGHQVRALDALADQVHDGGGRPGYLHPDVDLVVGNVEDARAVAYALDGIDRVVHLAARVGVGQSMYEPCAYTRTNNVGTAVLWEAIAARPVERVLVASSMSVYGEGLYRDVDGNIRSSDRRALRQLRAREWEPVDEAGRSLEPLPTPETKSPNISSLYALSKYDQECMSLMFGEAYDVPTDALRFFNVYGPRQALSNPYTGVLAIFASRLLNGKPPLLFEDGLQKRDFVHVRDVARACSLTLESGASAGRVLNVGSGEAHSIVQIAERLAAVMDVDIAPCVTGQYRVGDIRHCFADITRAQDELGYRPAVGLDEGLAELVAWLEGQTAVDRADVARHELVSRGLAI